MQALIFINDSPYGTERLYNGLRLAHALVKRVARAYDSWFVRQYKCPIISMIVNTIITMDAD